MHQAGDRALPNGEQQHGRVPTCENALYSSPCPPPRPMSTNSHHGCTVKAEQDGGGANFAARKSINQENWRDGDGPPSPAVNQARDPPGPMKAPAACVPGAASRTPASVILSPPEIFAAMARAGGEKCKFPFYKLAYLSILAGAYIGFGFAIALLVAGGMNQAPSNPDKSQVNVGVYRLVVGFFSFPFSLALVLINGGEVWTSMPMYSMCALYEGKCSVLDVLRVNAISWCGNFAGAGMQCGLFIASGIFEGEDSRHVRFLVEEKVSAGFGRIFVKSILGMWLIGLAVWQGNAAQDLTGKAIGVLMPTSFFGALGLENSTANMFVYPMGTFYGANITAGQFVADGIVAVSLGNIVATMLMIATSYATIYGRIPMLVEDAAQKVLSVEDAPKPEPECCWKPGTAEVLIERQSSLQQPASRRCRGCV
ncbi:Formate/nitrite transporter-domain-containing protein [Dunaliella salina]|uniref:Formate/nitrite transporter-domain-containing protein n=1 Tax=Dunaliella salina TaxID=3046 RepID=A0ABQ7H146_DUNSA|nr:Formate/nitrite transporter-domain-containing protein [Dunaliella salina]|eukprot:KAF5840578.1 Formate/nitrite transporter-domain-containing protein [Dunaliella salina]